MTTEADTTTREAWQQALARFTALRILFEADDQWGPLQIATARLQFFTSSIRRPSPGREAEWEAEHLEAFERHARELERHMAAIYDPLIKAGLEMVRTPAPDLDAVRVKHEACNIEAVRLFEHEDEEDELFGIIRADVQRLTGIVA